MKIEFVIVLHTFPQTCLSGKLKSYSMFTVCFVVQVNVYQISNTNTQIIDYTVFIYW